VRLLPEIPCGSSLVGGDASDDGRFEVYVAFAGEAITARVYNIATVGSEIRFGGTTIRFEGNLPRADIFSAFRFRELFGLCGGIVSISTPKNRNESIKMSKLWLEKHARQACGDRNRFETSPRSETSVNISYPE
jgi:hypothetical protein